MDTFEGLHPVVLALDRIEVLFLLTVLESCGEILTTILALQDCVPDLAPPPMNAEAIVQIEALARKIACQANDNRSVS